VPDSANHPTGGYEGVEWTGKDGTFWYFESHYRDIDNGASYGSDLWRYDPAIDQWAWIKGPATPNNTGHYGTLGIEDPSNLPPARGFGAASWTDTTGNLWMFGGYAYINGDIYYADLWRFNPETKNWMWVKGPQQPDQVPVRGIQGIQDPANHPGSRSEMISTWVDHENNLWLFGGITFDNGLPICNDLWKYSIADNIWTWMKGPSNYWSDGTYGLRGIEDLQNNPPARWAATTWTDMNGDLWLFGGRHTMNWTETMNDMWRYRIATNSWTWMNGSIGAVADTGNVGLRCEVDEEFNPQSRFECRSRWVDSEGGLWLWGGRTGTIDNTRSYLNDLWRYDIQSRAWALMWPDQPFESTGSFGEKGSPHPCNRPFGAMGNAAWYRTQSNSLYLFGGYQYRPDLPSSAAVRSLMWRLELDTNCISYECPYDCIELDVQVTVTHEDGMSGYGSVILSVSNGYQPYTINLDGEDRIFIDTLDLLATGPHDIVVTDAFGCTGRASFEIRVLDDTNDDGLIFFQDGDQLIIMALRGDVRIRLYDAIGRIVIDTPITLGENRINIASVAHGIYVYLVDDGSAIGKLFLR